MQQSFSSMARGLILAIILVYLLMATNFQSWLDPLIIMMAVPGALAGVLWMLVITRTTLNVESMMGAIMAVGVGVANGNLLISFANDLREQGHDAVSAAIQAGVTQGVTRSGYHDSARDDPRDVADVAGSGSRRRAECALGTRRD